jgi:hypothetical protein
LPENITFLYVSNIPNISSGISTDLSNIQVVLDPCVSRAIKGLGKIYNKDKKYGGELYDILATKLLDFYDICSKLGLDRHQYHYAYSFMLKGRAHRFYLTNLFNKNLDFDIIVTKTKEYFETRKNYQEYLSE